jgi:sugar/nucleoside kinase (ribokinase family)
MTSTHPTHIVLGELRRDYLITPDKKVLADQPGGDLLYTAEGVRLWLEEDESVGLVSRVGEDYPRTWIDDLAKQGYQTDGIKVLPEEIDLRFFRAYTDLRTLHHDDPVAHFSRLGLTMPRTLLGYSPEKPRHDLRVVKPTSLRQSDLPENFTKAGAAHLCPMDFISHSLMPAALRQAGFPVVTLDPGPYMQKEHWEDVKSLTIGLTAFTPSERELSDLFFGRTDDLREMIEEISSWGIAYVVVKRSWKGQILHDTAAHRTYEIPAYPSKMVDPTGAGDVFAGGLMAGLSKTSDPVEGVLYGTVAASFAVEGSGPFYTKKALPGLQQARMESIRDSVREI